MALGAPGERRHRLAERVRKFGVAVKIVVPGCESVIEDDARFVLCEIRAQRLGSRGRYDLVPCGDDHGDPCVTAGQVRSGLHPVT